MNRALTPVVIAVALLGSTVGPAAAQPVPEWTFVSGNITASPLRMADVDGDGAQDIILTTMGPIGSPFSAGFVYVFNADGTIQPGWPVVLGANMPIAGAALAVGDLDNDGDMELVVEGWFNIHVWNHDGTVFPGWPKATGTTFTASPALGDLDDDGDLEIVVPIGTSMHVWHHDGTELTGWPATAAEVFQTPALGDFDLDGSLEIVAGTWRANFPDPVTYELYMWDADGSVATGFPVTGLGSIRGPVSMGDVTGDGGVEIVTRSADNVYVIALDGTVISGPIPLAVIRNAVTALGDLDGDGDLEIVIGGFDLFAIHHDGTPLLGWPSILESSSNINNSPIIASIDGDTSTPEVMAKYFDNVAAIRVDGTSVSGFPVLLSDDNQTATFSGSPVIGDVDNDGDVEYALLSTSGTLRFYDEAEPFDASTAFWPQYGHDAFNSCYLPPAARDCPADCAGADGIVGIADLLALLAQWGGAGSCDLDGGGVAVTDLLFLLSLWGPC